MFCKVFSYKIPTTLFCFSTRLAQFFPVKPNYIRLNYFLLHDDGLLYTFLGFLSGFVVLRRRRWRKVQGVFGLGLLSLLVLRSLQKFYQLANNVLEDLRGWCCYVVVLALCLFFSCCYYYYCYNCFFQKWSIQGQKFCNKLEEIGTWTRVTIFFLSSL